MIPLTEIQYRLNLIEGGPMEDYLVTWSPDRMIVMKKIETISITKQQSYTVTAQGILMMFLGAAIFQTITGDPSNDAPIGVFIMVYIVTLIVHEMLHGLGFLIGGARPKFGVGITGILPYAYATSADKLALKNMLFVAYLPFVALSIMFIGLAVAMPEYSAFYMVGFVGNFAGAVGDIWIASRMLKYLRFHDVVVLDTKAGTELYSSSPDAFAVGKASVEQQKTTTSFWKVASVAFLSIVIVSAVVPVIMLRSGYTGSFKLGAGELYLFTVDSSNANTSATFNLLPAIVGGGIAGMIAVMRERYDKRYS